MTVAIGATVFGASAAIDQIYAPAASAAAPAALWNPFGAPSRDWLAHNQTGLDFSSFGQGTPMRAPHAGLVSTGHLDDVGNWLRITDPGGWKSCFFHLHAYAFVSTTVKMGDVIALSGGKRTPTLPGETVQQLTYESGSLPNGPHVHWHLEDGSTRRDPLVYVNSTGPGDSNNKTIGDSMTDVIYYASPSYPAATSAGLKSPATTVNQGSIWYQECVGAPLFKLSNTYDTIEYWAIALQRGQDWPKVRYEVQPAQIAALIDLRGEATAPKANTAPLRT